MTDLIGLFIGAAWGFSSVAAGLLLARAIHAADLRDQRGEGQVRAANQSHEGALQHD